MAKSDRHNNRIGLWALLWSGVLVSLLGLSCTVKHHRDAEVGDKALPEEVSMKADASRLEKLRKDIPEPVRTRNDELKEILSLMGEVRRRPEDIQRRFDRLHRKRREFHRRDLKKTRANYKKNEKAKKEAFKKKQKDEKAAYKRRKNTTREMNKEFYTQQDKERREFYNDIRAKRSDFESDIRQQSRDFDSDTRQQRKEFNEELRSYRRRYREWQQAKREGRVAAPANSSAVLPAKRQSLSPEEVDELRTFQKMRNLPSQPLTTDDN